MSYPVQVVDGKWHLDKVRLDDPRITSKGYTLYLIRTDDPIQTRYFVNFLKSNSAAMRHVSISPNEIMDKVHFTTATSFPC